jgi:uncharacterized membrane protein YfcA
VPDLSDVLLLCAAAAFAGWVDAISGGGGLVQLPAMLVLLPGAAPAAVLATNKLSSICGTTAAALTYQRRVRPDLRTALPMAAVALAGSAGGALCASLLPREVFRPLVLMLLVAVAAWTVARPRLGLEQRLRFDGHRHHLVAAAAGAGIGFYDGIFGPGTGAFLVVALVGLLGYAFLQASATARIVNVGTNLGALLVFVPQGAPLWRLGLAMGACNVAGGWLGAHTAISRGSGFVRVVFLVVVAALVVRLGYDVLRGA